MSLGSKGVARFVLVRKRERRGRGATLHGCNSGKRRENDREAGGFSHVWGIVVGLPDYPYIKHSFSKPVRHTERTDQSY